MLIKNFAETIAERFTAPGYLCSLDGDGGGDGGAAGSPQSPGGDGVSPQTPGGDPADAPISMTKSVLTGRIKSAEKAAERAALSGVFAKLGVTSSEELDALAQEREASRTEAQRLKLEHDRLKREHDALASEVEQHRQWKANAAINAALDEAIEAEAAPSKDKDGREIPGREVFSRKQLRALLAPSLKYSDDKVMVIGPDGEPDSKTSVHKALKAFLDANPNQVKSRVGKGGVGSSPATGAAPPASEYNHKDPSARAEMWAKTVTGSRR